MLIEQIKAKSWDERRFFIVPGDYNSTLIFCVEHFIAIANESIADHGAFFVALSGGTTPKAIFEHLCTAPYKEKIDWKKLYLFWSDERSVSPDDPQSNFNMAMEAGFKEMPIPPSQIHRMHAEKNIEENALRYEELIKKNLGKRPFDLIMLGMGPDGHTASLFPHTEGLKVRDRLVIANYVPQHETWRMTMTFDCINRARHIAIYVLGASKKQTLKDVLRSADQFDLYPVQRVGTKEHKALWIADEAAAALLI
jgi:6-phosphogluconolactonase